MRAGVVGTGHLGYHHARILRGLADSVAVFDSDRGRASQVSQELGVALAGTRDELFDSVDAVVVACTTVSHHEVVMAALEADLPVLVEKPMAADSLQATELESEASKRGLTLAVGHVERFNPAVTAASPLLADPRFVEAHRLASFKPRGTDVSVVLDLMIHDIDLVLSFVHSEVAAVRASGVAVLTDSTDIASARIEFRNGAVANLTASRISREPMRKLRFFLDRRYVSIDFAGRSVEALELREGEIRPVPVRVGGADPLTCELEDFLESCRTGRPPLVGAAEGVRALRAAEMIAAEMPNRPGV